MKQLLRIILIILVLTLCGQDKDLHAGNADRQYREELAQVAEYLQGKGRHNLRWDKTLSDRETPAAVLTDGENVYRICNSRPQRLLPSYGSKPGKTAARTVPIANRYQPYKHYCGRQSAGNRLLPLHAPCDYYVIALRHIIR